MKKVLDFNDLTNDDKLEICNNYGLNLTIEELEDLNNEGEISFFSSVEDLAYWLFVQDSSVETLFELLVNTSVKNIKGHNDDKSIIDVLVETSGGVILNDKFIMYIYGY